MIFDLNDLHVYEQTSLNMMSLSHREILQLSEDIILWFSKKIGNFEVHKDRRRKKADLETQ